MTMMECNVLSREVCERSKRGPDEETWSSLWEDTALFAHRFADAARQVVVTFDAKQCSNPTPIMQRFIEELRAVTSEFDKALQHEMWFLKDL